MRTDNYPSPPAIDFSLSDSDSCRLSMKQVKSVLTGKSFPGDLTSWTEGNPIPAMFNNQEVN